MTPTHRLAKLCDAPFPALSEQVPRYDAGRFIQKLRGKLVSKAGSRTYFDWRLLGREAGTCFNSVPSRVSFLHGPIDVVYVPKERKKRERRRHEDDGGEEEEVEQIDQKKSKSDADKLSAVERNITIVNTVLNKKTNEASKRSLEAFEADAKAANLDENEMRRKRRHVEKEGPFVDAVQHLFNPKSFTQTVENIFHFSFLVKKGTAAIHLRDEDEAEKYGGMPGPVVRAFPKGTTPCPRQSIVALNMQVCLFHQCIAPRPKPRHRTACISHSFPLFSSCSFSVPP